MHTKIRQIFLSTKYSYNKIMKYIIICRKVSLRVNQKQFNHTKVGSNVNHDVNQPF